ncbi:DUF697 domain-containing protein [Herbaspirillum sp. NPDC101396]|uniref:DUF697 domain-containing protein n=1 Tax=Herbaspirillum sp. NPDC101396 TaxID=3364005 RepID=UPI00383B3218
MTAPAPLTRAALRRLHAQDVIIRHTSMAGASMAIPVPLLDMAAALSIQVRMAKKLCALYDAEFNRTAARDVITGILGGLSPGSLSATALRYLSFASYFAGTLPSAGLSAAYTYVLGELLMGRLIANGRIDLPSPGEIGERQSSASPELAEAHA